jgi:hypothetical protein
MTIRQGLKLSGIIDKLGLKIENPKGSKEEVGSDLILQIVAKAHRAEKEIISFVAVEKKISEEAAADVDLIEFAKEMAKDSGIMGFIKSAVK